MKLKVKKLHKDAKLPTHGHPGDAGIDFYALENVVFLPGKQERVHTGVAIEIPGGHVGLIWDKSNVSFNLGLKIMGGVIDAGYRGELIMNLLNTSGKEVLLEKGHKIAQMLTNLPSGISVHLSPLLYSAAAEGDVELVHQLLPHAGVEIDYLLLAKKLADAGNLDEALKFEDFISDKKQRTDFHRDTCREN